MDSAFLCHRFRSFSAPTSLLGLRILSRTTEYLRINIQLSVIGCSSWVGCSVIYGGCNVGKANISTYIESVIFLTLRDI